MAAVYWGVTTKTATNNGDFTVNALKKLSNQTSGTDWLGFFDALGKVEGNDSYQIQNGKGFLGLYQYDPRILKDPQFTNTVGAMFNGTTVTSFRNDPIEQELAALMEFSGVWPSAGAPKVGGWSSRYTQTQNAAKIFANFGFAKFGQLVNQWVTIQWTQAGADVGTPQTIQLTPAGISAAAHLVGQAGVAYGMSLIYAQLYNTDGTPKFTAGQVPTVTLDVSSSISVAGSTVFLADGSGIAFSTYIQLYSQFDISTLIGAQNTPAKFDSLALQLITFRKGKILDDLSSTKQPVVMAMLVNSGSSAISYAGTIQAVLQGLGLPTNQLTNISGNVVLADGDYTDASGNRSDLIFGLGSGPQSLTGGKGNDVLYAGTGADTLSGGAGNDTYEIPVPAGIPLAGPLPGATNTIIDTDGQGSIVVGNQGPLGTGLTLRSSGTNGSIWADGNGYQYLYSPGLVPNVGKLTISQGQLGTGQIVIDNFSLIAAQTNPNGYLGIHFQRELAINTGTADQFQSSNFSIVDQAAAVLHGAVQTFTVAVSDVQEVAQTLTLKLSSAAASVWKLITGADTLSFASDGTVQITIPAGQGSVTLGLVDTTNTNQVDSANLTATLTDANGTVTSNNLAITFDNPNPGTGSGTPPTNIITGDFTPINYGTPSAPVYHYDALGNVVTDGTLDAAFNDTLYGSSGNDSISTGGGTNIVNAAQGGNDTIIGGSGSDAITAGNGDNVIVGNGSAAATSGLADVIIAGNGDNQIYADSQTDLASALAAQSTATASGARGDFIAAGDGDNLIVGGLGNDVIFAGTGTNTIVCGPGAVQFFGGVEVSAASVNWTESPQNNINLFVGVSAQSASFTTSGPYNGNTYNGVPVGLGNDNIFGGSGNDSYYLSNGNNWLDAGGGNDLIQAGMGSNTIFAGTGNDTLYGAGGSNYIDLESGNDVVIAQGGSQTIIGGTGNDTIFSGDASANWANSETSASNYIDGGSGNTAILGSAGNDTLTSGSEAGTGQSTTIYAGNGNEYLIGGAGSDTLYGGAGSDIIDAGEGNTTIELSSEPSETSTVYGGAGSDSITGGAGSDVIYTGDGGTMASPTQVNIGTGTSSVYGGAGVDVISASTGNDSLYAGSGTSTLQGGSGTDVLVGGEGTDTLIAGSGNDTLVAGSGSESMLGGSGNTVYQFNPGFGNVEIANAKSTDTLQFGSGIALADLTVTATLNSNGNPALLIEDDNGGSLTIDGGLDSSINNFTFSDGGASFTLDQLMAQANAAGATQATDVAGANGDLIFAADGSESLTGDTGNDTIYAWGGTNTLTAGTGNDQIYSEDGNDQIVGGPGNSTLYSIAGNDTMIGGSGNTTFVINSTSDTIVEQPNSGNNTVISSVSYTLPENIQNLTLTRDDLKGTGNDLNNVLTAHGANDTLIAGSGVDTLLGGGHDDTFVIDNAADVVVEQPNTSNNTVISSVSYSLPDNVQNLMFTGGNAVTGTGNDLNNVLTANSGGDTLISGSGIDTLIGGSGNDAFVINNAADVVQEQSGGGNDTVFASVSYTLPDNVENLTLTGSADLSATGNSANDVITADSGNDTLDGGSGNASLIGGAGQDTFLMDWNMGIDTAVDSSSQGAIVKLAPGVDFSDLSAFRQGNDLLLQINGALGTLRIQNYYTTPQTGWTIVDANGATTTAQALIDATAQQQGDAVTLAENAFIHQTEASIAAGYLAQGYTRQSALSFYLPLHSPQWEGQEVVSDVTVIQTQFASTGPVTSSYGFTNEDHGITAEYTPSDASASIQVVNSTSDGPLVFSVAGLNQSQSSELAWFEVEWTQAKASSTGPIFFGGSSNIIVVPGPGGIATPEVFNSVTNTTTTDFIGTVTGIAADPGSLSSTLGNLPRAVEDEFVHQQQNWTIEHITLGPSDHTVYAGPYTLVDAGSGDNTIYDAGFAYGGSGNDTMIGGGTLMAGSGNDLLIGGQTMIAGTGNDQMYAVQPPYYGSQNPATFVVDGSHPGSALIGGNRDDSPQLLSAYYQALGLGFYEPSAVVDWKERYALAGSYQFWGDGPAYGDLQDATAYAAQQGETFAQAIQRGDVRYINPLPVLVTAPGITGASKYYLTSNVPTDHFSANDFAKLAPYFADGALPANRVLLGAGFSSADPQLSWGQVIGAMSGQSSDPQLLYTTLNITSDAGEVVQIMIPHAKDPIGSGVQEVEFADGTTLNMAQLVSMAPPAPSFDPEEFVFSPGMGQQQFGLIGTTDISFASPIQPADVTVSRDGIDLLLSYNHGSDVLRVPGWYANPSSMPTLPARFSDGTTWDANTLTNQGLIVDGSAGNQTLTGLAAFVNVLEGGPNDTLIGGGGADTFVFNPGGGQDTVIENADPNQVGSASIQFGAGISQSSVQLTPQGPDLLVTYGTQGDSVLVKDIVQAGGAVIGTFYFADGSYDTYSNDGQGNATITQYDSSGNETADSWTSSDGSHGTDTFNADGSSNSLSYNADGSYTTVANDGQGNSITTNYDATGTRLSDSWTHADGTTGSDTYNADGSIESLVTYTYSDGSTYSTDTISHPDGSYQQSWSKSDGSHGTSNYNAATGETSGSNATAGAGYSYTYDNTQLSGGATESKITYTYDDGSTYATDTIGEPNGSYQQSWTKSDGSHGTSNYNAATGETSGSNATAGAGYSYTYDNTQLGGGVTESKITYTYSDGSTYSTDTINDPNGSYQQSWTKSDGSHGTSSYDATTGQTSGSNATSGVPYSYSYQSLQLGGGVTESKITYTYSDGSTYSTDTVNDPNGSYQQSWAKSDGSHGTSNYNAATGETSGSNATAGAGDSYTYDNLQLGGDVTESKITYTYSDGSTYSTDTVNDPDGSYQQSWSKSDGSQGTSNYNAVTGETSGSNATAGAGYSYTYDNTLLGSGVTESKITYTYSDGSSYSTDTVNDPDGSYQQSWSKSDGSQGTSNYNAVTGETSGSNATAGAGYSYTYDNTQLGAGVTESKITYTYSDGSTYSTDTVNDPDGSYQQSWSKSDGSHGTSNYNAVTGETSGSNATAGAGYSYTYDNTKLGGGATESKITYIYSDGSTYSTDTVNDPDGSYQQSWSKSDGSHGTSNYNAVTGETSGSNATVGVGYSYTYDNTKLGGGATESQITYTYSDGSTYSTDTVHNADGSYQQSWMKSDGTAGSVAVNASGALVGDSSLAADGSQEVDAAGNELLMGSSSSANVTGASGNDLLIGGSGNHLVTTGGGTNLIAFDQGDGQDTVNTASGQNNALSLGGGFAYDELSFQKNGNDLVLDIGSSDSLTFQNWYAAPANQSIVTLQVIAAAMSDFNPGSSDVLRSQSVETFDFQQLVGAFDHARAANPSLTSWALTNALLDAHLSGSDTAALGGDLAYQYGVRGNLTGFSVASAESALSSSQFAATAQTLNPWPSLNTGNPKLK